jgi:hypothetical protein
MIGPRNVETKLKMPRECVKNVKLVAGVVYSKMLESNSYSKTHQLPHMVPLKLKDQMAFIIKVVLVE